MSPNWRLKAASAIFLISCSFISNLLWLVLLEQYVNGEPAPMPYFGLLKLVTGVLGSVD